MTDDFSQTSISEFERTKPVETMKALNKLIKKLTSFVESDKEPNIFLAYGMLEDVVKDLNDIKEKLKRGD